MNPYREQIDELAQSLDRIAHSMATGLGYDEYLVQVGKYKALKEHRAKLIEKLKTREVEDTPEAGVQHEAPTTRRPVIANRPRSWGGGRNR